MDIRIDASEYIAIAKRLNAGPEVLREEMITALTEVGLVAEGTSKELAPIDTGRLRKSITAKPEYPMLTVGTDVEYAIYQELGTENPDGTVRIKAKRFLQRGYEDNVSKIQDIFQSAISRATGRILGG